MALFSEEEVINDSVSVEEQEKREELAFFVFTHILIRKHYRNMFVEGTPLLIDMVGKLEKRV